MKIPYLQSDGQFRPQIRPALRALAVGAPVRVALGKGGGYEGQIVVRIGEDNAAFEAAIELGDVTRFPARIRAAATELKAQGFLGTFLVGHENGALAITPAAIAVPVKRVPASSRRDWTQESPSRELRVVNPTFLPDAVRGRWPAALTPEQVDLIGRQLDDRCRDVEE